MQYVAHVAYADIVINADNERDAEFLVKEILSEIAMDYAIDSISEY